MIEEKKKTLIEIFEMLKENKRKEKFMKMTLWEVKKYLKDQELKKGRENYKEEDYIEKLPGGGGRGIK